ncbi:MAG: hypothetical protein ABL921_13820 [Pirellula sp.]
MSGILPLEKLSVNFSVCAKGHRKKGTQLVSVARGATLGEKLDASQRHDIAQSVLLDGFLDKLTATQESDGSTLFDNIALVPASAHSCSGPTLSMQNMDRLDESIHRRDTRQLRVAFPRRVGTKSHVLPSGSRFEI